MVPYNTTLKILKVKRHSRHYWLGCASWSLRRGDYEEVDKSLQVIEQMQEDIDELERELCL